MPDLAGGAFTSVHLSCLQGLTASQSLGALQMTTIRGNPSGVGPSTPEAREPKSRVKMR